MNAAQCARERGGGGQEERQRRVHAVVNAGEIVAEFVRHQNGEQCEREGQSGEEERGAAETQHKNIGVVFDIEKRQVVAEIVLHVRAHERGREHGQYE